MGARVLWASPTMRTICASSVSAPTRSARITTVPVPLIVPPVTRAPVSFSTGMGSPVTIDSSTELRPSTTTPSTGIFSPGRTRSRSPTVTLVNGDVLFAPVADPARLLRRKTEQLANRAARLPSGTKLEHLPEQHERDDDDRRIEVRLDNAMNAEAFREDSRRKRSRHAEGVRRPDAERDQREHVRAAVDDRRPPALEERPAGPEDDRRPEHQADPVGDVRIETSAEAHAEDHVSHSQQKHRRAEQRRNREPARHVGQLGVRQLVGRHRAGLERHAADRTGARLVAHDLGVHRARVFDARRRGRCEIRLERHAALRAGAGMVLPDLGIHRAHVGRAPYRRGRDVRLRRQERFGIRSETLETARMAEVVARAVVVPGARCRRRIDGHPANRIDDLCALIHVGCLPVLTGRLVARTRTTGATVLLFLSILWVR